MKWFAFPKTLIWILLVSFKASLGAAGHPEGGPEHSPSLMRATPSMDRTPSLSLVPSQPRQQNISSPQRQRPANPSHPPQAQQELRNRFPKQFHTPSPSRTAPRPNQRSTTLNQQSPHNRELAQQARNRIKQNNPGSHEWFDKNFFTHHHNNPSYAYGGAGWWGGNSWDNMNSWLGWGWDSPVYYDNSDMYNVNEADQEIAMSSQSPLPPENSGDWYPLGIFAVGASLEQLPFSNMFVQMALNKEGSLAGTYYNSSTDQTYPLQGFVDKDNQQVAWVLSDKPASPLMTTGLYNLMQESTSLQVHFTDGSQQTWYLVRMEE